MQKNYKHIVLSSMALVILFISLSAVSAVDDDNFSSLISEDASGNDYILHSSPSSIDDLAVESDDNSHEHASDLISTEKLGSTLNNSTFVIDCDNFTSYFVDGKLMDDFEGSTLVFCGEFADKGIISISSPGVTVVGNNSLLRNSVFCLESCNIMLSGLNFVLDQEFSNNDNAGILVLGDNCTIYNCTMNYNVPEAKSGFCVYAEGNKIENFTLSDSRFNFIGNNLGGGWDYGIFLDGVDNAIVYGNSINCSLPLRSVNWNADIYGGVSMDAVGAFVAQESNYLTLSNNNISAYVNGGGTSYPTLDTVILYGCNNATVEENRIYCEDFNSKDGKDNYLQGIDVYFANDVTILNNMIDIHTTGGRPGYGTAYPIQVNGPSYNVKIAFNNITTFNFGPNIGIYSQNYYGDTKIDIISNFINVTGVASTHYWALVAGIEVQDSDDLILNNTIIVNNLGSYNDNNNIYGISYSQNTKGNHTYNMQYNNVTTNGRYAVLLSGTDSLVVNSIIANNVLNSDKLSGNRAIRVGAGVNNTIRNNTDGVFINTMSADELPDWIRNHVSIVPIFYREGSRGSGFTDNAGNATAPWNMNGGSGGANSGNGHNVNRVSGNGTNPVSDSVLGSDIDTAPGLGGDDSPSISAASSGDSGSSAADPDAYEINERDNFAAKSVDYNLLGIISVVALIFLLIGYKREKDEEEEE